MVGEEVRGSVGGIGGGGGGGEAVAVVVIVVVVVVVVRGVAAETASALRTKRVGSSSPRKSHPRSRAVEYGPYGQVGNKHI